MPTVDILPFAGDPGANVQSQADYAADDARTQGYAAGLASSAKMNKALRQSSFIASALASWIGNQGYDVLDDGNLNNLVATMQLALGFIQSGQGARPRTLQSKTRARFTPVDFGAIGNNASHPLSDTYADLAAAQAVYPFVTSLTQQTDWAAVQAAQNALTLIGGGTITHEPGKSQYYLGDDPVRLRPNVSMNTGGIGRNRTTVTWDYRGPGVTFYSDETLNIIELDIGEISHVNNVNAAGSVDGIWFKKGFTGSRCVAALVVGAATNNFVILYGKNPDDASANNDQYRDRWQLSTRGAVEAPGVGLWLNSDDTVNTRCNGHYIEPGTKLDAFKYPFRTCGNGNVFDHPVSNGPASGAMFYFEGNTTYSNTIIAPYNDGALTGKFMILNNTSTVDREMAQVINPANYLAASDFSDISSGTGVARVGIRQASSGSGPFPGRPYSSVYATGAMTNFVYDEFDVDASGRTCIGGTVNAAQSLRVQNTPTGTNQVGIGAYSTFGADATGAIDQFRSEGKGKDAGGAYTSVLVCGFRAASFTKGVNQTVTSYFGHRTDDQTVGTNNYGYFSNMAAGAGKWNFYASGDAANYFAGTIASLGSYTATTASAANLNIASDGSIARSTSSEKYKTDIQNLDASRAQAMLNLRPVRYRSKCAADRKDWSYYGLIAEEVATIDPRLVHWGYPHKEIEIEELVDYETKPADVEEMVDVKRDAAGRPELDADGAEIPIYKTVRKNVPDFDKPIYEKLRRLVPDTDQPLQAEGVQYDRLTVMLLSIIQQQEKRIQALEAKPAKGKS